jgi:Spy/CpxP family protein refolding chaperone
MSRKSTLTVVATVLLILVLALAACAQLYPTGQRPPKVKGQNQTQTQAQGQGGFLAEAWAGGRQHIGAFASLERILIPPSKRELQKMGMVLNPTEEQKTQIKALYKTLFDAVKAVAPQKQDGIKAVLAGLAGASPNKTDIEASASKVEQADQAIISAEIDFWIGLKTILTPQQQTQVQTMFQERMQHEINPRQGGPGGPPPGGPPPQQ